MEVMAEANEQPALLNQDVDDVKKPRRTKTAARPRRTPASKTGARRAKKETKDDEPISSETNNHLPLLESREGDLENREDASSQNMEAAPELVSEQPRGFGESTEQSNERKNTEMFAPVEEPVMKARTAARLHEPPPTVEAPRYDPVFGEGLIEVSGKGFGFLRDPKRNYVQSPQDIFVTPEVVRKHALRDGLWIKGEVRRGSRGPQLFKLLLINGEDPDKYRNLPVFEELTSINPLERIRMETIPDRY